MGRMTEAVKHILIINVILFFATQLYGDQMYQWLALWFPKNENFQIWQIITHMFMHGGFMHIAFNMFALWMFGTPVERVLGKNRFLFVYFSAGLGAVLFQLGFYYFEHGALQSANIGYVGFKPTPRRVVRNSDFHPKGGNARVCSNIQCQYGRCLWLYYGNFGSVWNDEPRSTAYVDIFAHTHKGQIFYSRYNLVGCDFRNYGTVLFQP